MQKILTGIHAKTIIDGTVSRQMLPLLPLDTGAKP
jgi:hypothetical protein